jgi:hypothetical protein
VPEIVEFQALEVGAPDGLGLRRRALDGFGKHVARTLSFAFAGSVKSTSEIPRPVVARDELSPERAQREVGLKPR